MDGGAQLLEAILPAWRESAAAVVGAAWFDRYLERHREGIVRELDAFKERVAAKKRARLVDAPEEMTPARRTKANLEAMWVAFKRAPGDITDDDRAKLLGYSGWGGLSLEKVQGKFPPGWKPDDFALIHEYYTPRAVADAIGRALAPYLRDLAGRGGVIDALEPSAGIGRLVRGVDAAAASLDVRLQWSAVELSQVSAAIFERLHREARLRKSSLERWVTEEGSKFAGCLKLVVANPPYGERGVYLHDDAVEEYQHEKRAYVYAMRRTLDLLAPRGIGVYLVPAGFLSSSALLEARNRVLRRHHLMGAFRLPSDLFPGAKLVVDLLFFRARGGELAVVDEADEFILEGRYFDQHPRHILGREVGKPGSGDTSSWRYQVQGEFTGLPRLEERPLCTACIVRPFEFKARRRRGIVREAPRARATDLSPGLSVAIDLGARVEAFARALVDAPARALAMHCELCQALRDLRAADFLGEGDGHKNPWRWLALRKLADAGDSGAVQFLAAFTKQGALQSWIEERPKVEPSYRGDPGDVVSQAEELFKQRRELTLDELLAYHHRVGGGLRRDEALALLFASKWSVDWSRDEPGVWLEPLDVHLSGDLWTKLDAVTRRLEDEPEDAQLRSQAERLRGALELVGFEDIPEVSPMSGWIALELVSEWWRSRGAPDEHELTRSGGFVHVAGTPYERTDELRLTGEAEHILGWLNHDNTMFSPDDAPEGYEETDPDRPQSPDEDPKKLRVAERRRRWVSHWIRAFTAWIAEDDERRERVADMYNRTVRGYVVPTYPPHPLGIARWSPQIKLHGHQISGARRVLDQRGGLVAFDVGVGKTYTGLAILARARQDGWARRPVVLVPNSLAWKWFEDFARVLPDYRVAVIGSERYALTSRSELYKRHAQRLAAGEITPAQFQRLIVTSRADKLEEQAAKWTSFQAGAYDAVIVTPQAFVRTQLQETAARDYLGQVAAIQRSVKLEQRNAQHTKKPSERQRAILKHGVEAWMRERLELPKNLRPVPGVTWDAIGVDLLLVDEAADYKNLYMPEPREGDTPKYMGSGGSGSARAWHLDARANTVRQRTGGAGVVLLTATPAKNSPLEFYNLIQYIDPRAWTRIGIHDPEAFIDRYIRIEPRLVPNSALEPVTRQAVVGFKNLDELRGVIFRYGEFRTAKDVGIKLPQPRKHTVEVDMDDRQEAKYELGIELIEEALESPGPSPQLLGLTTRLGLVALHGDGDEGYEWETADGGVGRRKIPVEALAAWLQRGWHRTGDAQEGMVPILRDLPRPDPRSAKFVAIARRIAATPDCGHIVFCEPKAAHRWLVTVLEEHGIPSERIAVMNGAVTKAADRQRIAKQFNGDAEQGIEPDFDVVIANRVAYEGVDLQVRTCAIHHADLPWTPSDLEQRNGRAWRQGNSLGTIEIFYYVSKRSMDGYRFTILNGKATWLEDLLVNNKREVNNPATEDVDLEELLIHISRKPERTRALIEKKKREREEARRLKEAAKASAALRRASAVFRDARNAGDPERAAELRARGEQLLRELHQVPTSVWPWARWIDAVREREVVVPDEGASPVFEGLRVPREPAHASIEFGRARVVAGGRAIGVRRSGAASWEPHTERQVRELGLRPEQLEPLAQTRWPDDDDARTEASLAEHLSWVFRSGRRFGPGSTWTWASDAFVRRWWPVAARQIRDGLAASYSGELVPIVVDGALRLAKGKELLDGEILPMTREGWHTYLRLGPGSGRTLTELRDAGEAWWGRRVPHTLLADAKKAAGANGDAPAKATSLMPAPMRALLERVRAEEAASKAAETTATAPTPDDKRAPKGADSSKPASGGGSGGAAENGDAGDEPDPRRFSTVDARASRVLDALVRGLDVGDGHRIDNSPGVYMAVSVDRTGERTFAVAHNHRLEGGELLADPDVELVRLRAPTERRPGAWAVVAIQQMPPFGYRRLLELRDDDTDTPIPRRDRETNDAARFVDGWMRNIVDQQGGLEALVPMSERWEGPLLGRLRRVFTVRVLRRAPQELRVELAARAGVDGQPTQIGAVTLYSSELTSGWDFTTERSYVRRWAREVVDAALRGDDENLALLAETSWYAYEAGRGDMTRFRPTALEEGVVSDDPDRRQLATILIDLAAQSDYAMSSTAEFFREQGMPRAAALLEEHLAARPDQPLDDVLAAIAAAIADELPALPVRLDEDGAAVPPGAVADGPRPYVVVENGDVPRQINVVSRGDSQGEDGYERVVLADPIKGGAQVYVDEAPKIAELAWTRYRAMREALRFTPAILEETRLQLERAVALALTAPCAGEERSRVRAALWQARSIYREAAREVVDGRPVDVLERIAAIAREVADAAESLADACSRGQTTIAPVELPASLADADERITPASDQGPEGEE